MRVSGIVAVFILTTFQVLLATSGKAQDISGQMVTVELNNESLISALNKIEQQTSLRFFYRRAEIKSISNLRLPLQQRTVEKTLDEILANTFLAYRQIDNKILLEQKKEQLEFQINGKVVGVDKKGLEFVTVALTKIDTGKLIQTTFTDVNGDYKLIVKEIGDYQINISSIGMTSSSLALSLRELKVVKVPDVTLIVSKNELNEVVVTGSKPVITQDIDKISYNVQADPASKGENMLDMMRKVPMVSLDGEDNIKLKGNSNYKILINGRPSNIMSGSPRDVLRGIPASSILKIEVITSPPAKYDSEGLGGIINIVTNRKVDQGYKGSVGTFYNSIFSKGAFGNATLKMNSLAVAGFFGGYFQHDLGSTSLNYRTGTHPIQSRVDQEVVNNRISKSGGSSIGNVELSYEIDTLNLLTGFISLNSNSRSQNSDQFFTIFDHQNNLDQSYWLNKNERTKTAGNEVSINYQLGFKKANDRILTASYYYSESDNDITNRNLTNEVFNYTNNDLRQQNGSGSREQTAQLDYVQNIKKIGFESGVKFIIRDLNSDFSAENYNPLDGLLMAGSTRGTQFDYAQTIYAFYNSYELKLNDWGFKGGLRLERTGIDANFLTQDTKLNRRYNNFIPSIIVRRKFDNLRSISLGYTQRIQRPGIGQLNPFVNQLNPLFSTSGNPDLLPVLNHNFEFSFSQYKKGSLNTSLDYSFADNAIQNLVTLGADSISRSTFKNIGKNDNVGLNLNVNYPITKEFNITLNGRLSQVWVEGTINDKIYKNNGLQGYMNGSLSYSFKNDWRVSTYLWGNTPSIILQGRSGANYSAIYAINKSLFKKKMSVYASVSNPFRKYNHLINHINTSDFVQYSNTANYIRGFYINFVYHFGNLKEDIKKNKRGVNNDDIIKEKERE
jgi:outer membrane receptor protein involved in Fe transport